VEIEFGRQTIKGLVLEKTFPPRFHTKLIKKVKITSLLTKKQIALAKKISAFYLSPLGIVLKFFIISLTKKEQPLSYELANDDLKIIPTLEQKKAVAQIRKSKKNISLIFGPASSGKTEVLMELLAINNLSKKQSLILVPEIFLGYQEIDRYRARFKSMAKKNEIAFYHSKLKPSEISHIYQGVKTGKIKVIIATRMGIFLPFKRLGLIALDEEQDSSYKQWDMSPYYHTKTIATFLIKQFKAKLILLSATPSAETFLFAQKGKYAFIKLPPLKIKTQSIRPPHFKIVDLSHQYLENKNSFLSPQLKKQLVYNQQHKLISCILVPVRGKSRSIICFDCKKTLLCDHCNRPLIHNNKSYRCLHCTYKISPLTAKCPSCGSFRLIDFGFGTQNISEKIKELFPEMKVALADQNTFSHEKNRKKIYRQLKNNKLDVLVGTYSIAKGLDFDKITLVAIPDADYFPGKNNYLFDENYLANIFQLAGRVNRPKSNQQGICLLQTSHPHNPLLKILQRWDWEKFMQQELITRKSLNYPPFVQLIKITIKSSNLREAEKNIRQIYRQLKKTNGKNIEIILPDNEKILKTRGSYYPNLLIKSAYKNIPEKIKTILIQSRKNPSIDINPIAW